MTHMITLPVSRWANIVNLFNYLYRTTCCFNGCFSGGTDGIHFEYEFTFQLTVTQQFNIVRLTDYAIDIKVLQVELGD